MNESRSKAQIWLRESGVLAQSERARHPLRHGAQRAWRGGLARLAGLAHLTPLAAGASVLIAPMPAAAQAQPVAAPASERAPLPPVDVVVTGYRRSLSAALQRKQSATGQVDVIVAEDIAEFPDLNLADSLQRLPGVAVTRTNGEANQITVRGLSSLYTRVRINGMEVRGNVAEGAGALGSGGRGFDFNLFASELFNSVVVHKTPSADLDEGSLGAVVDVNVARAFDYQEGWTLVTGATGVYNDLSDTVRPRLTGLIAYRDPGGIWGATASAAYHRVRLDAVSTETVNWQKGAFRSVDGVACFDDMGTPTGDPNCLDIADAFHPRIPRFGHTVFRGDRIGLTAGVQLRPTHLTEIRLDALYANYPTRLDQRRLFPLIRNNERQIDLSNDALVRLPDRFGIGNDSLIAGTLNNSWIRAEHVRQDALARFYQIGLNIDQRFTDTLYLSAFAGTSRSKSGLPHDTTVNYDNRAYDDVRFDFTDDEAPLLAFNGLDVADPATWVVPELRDRVGSIEGGFDDAVLNLHLDLLHELKLTAGANYEKATYDTEQSNRDGTLCALNLYECDTDGDGMDDVGVLGPPGDPALTEWVNYPGATGPGSTTRWASPTVGGWVSRLGYYDAPLTLTPGATNEVTEKDLGYYLQARGEVMLGLGDMRLLYDAGLRYVETRQSSAGYRSGTWVKVDRPTYRDWLPTANAAVWFTQDLVLRLAAAQMMARPELGNVSPGASVDSIGYNINFQNPNLDPTRATVLDAAAEWYFAEDSLLSVAVFSKDIDSFPIRTSRKGTFASTRLPRSVIQPLSPADLSGEAAEGSCGDPAGCWSISELSNGPGATVKGVELGIQAPLRAFAGALPVVLRDMGFVANYTYVDSKSDYQYFGNTVRERPGGLSNGQYNATLYYDDATFSARASLAYRSNFLTGGPSSQGNLWEITESATRLDASTSYDVTEHLKLSLDALNLTNTPFDGIVDIDAKRRAQYSKFGRTYLLGARLSY